MTGFAHDIAGGQGNLIVTSLQSPNFVSGVSGWQVSRNGNAQFNSLSIRGTFLGLDYEITPNGLFFYSGNLPSPLNSNPYFANANQNQPNGAGWGASNGSFSVSSSPPSGAPYVYAGMYVNNGIGPGALEENGTPITIIPGQEYVVSTWVYSSVTTIQLGFDWLENGTFVSASTQNIGVPANTWTQITTTQTAPASGVNQAFPRVGTISGNSGIIYAQAVTVYNQGSANLLFYIVNSAGVDQYGNVVTPVAGVTGTGQFHAGNSVLTENGFYLYNGTPESGNLPVLVIANGSSTVDPFGGSYLPNDILVDSIPYIFMGPQSNGSYIQIAPNGPAGAFTALGTGDASEVQPSQFTAVISGTGGARTLVTTLISPQFTGKYALVQVSSQSEDNATQGAYAVIGSTSGNELLVGDTSSGATVAEINSTDGNVYDIRHLTHYATGQTLSSTSPVAIAGFSHAMKPGIYEVRVRVYGGATVAAGTHTLTFAFSGTATGIVNAIFWQPQAANAAPTQATLMGQALTAGMTSPTHVNTGAWAEIDAVITVTVAGTLTMTGLVSVAADTYQINAGSYMKVSQ
jgi:hypothetical protein